MSFRLLKYPLHYEIHASFKNCSLKVSYWEPKMVLLLYKKKKKRLERWKDSMDVKGSSWNHKNQWRTFIFGVVFSAVFSPVHHIEHSCSCCLLRDGGVCVCVSFHSSSSSKSDCLVLGHPRSHKHSCHVCCLTEKQPALTSVPSLGLSEHLLKHKN